jgi:hypothetical protein
MILISHFVLLFSLFCELGAKCMCGPYLGSLCGKRVNDGALEGDCKEDIIYYCHSAKFFAQEKGYCSYCAYGNTIGNDFCSVEKIEG